MPSGHFCYMAGIEALNKSPKKPSGHCGHFELWRSPWKNSTISGRWFQAYPSEKIWVKVSWDDISQMNGKNIVSIDLSLPWTIVIGVTEWTNNSFMFQTTNQIWFTMRKMMKNLSIIPSANHGHQTSPLTTNTWLFFTTGTSSIDKMAVY